MYNVEISDITFRDDVMVICWSANIGFGELTVFTSGEPDEHTYSMDTECCSAAFAKEVIEAASKFLITNAKII